ncbi:MAG: hypothetical protein ABWW70_01570 [Thermoproteota archaeon]
MREVNKAYIWTLDRNLTSIVVRALSLINVKYEIPYRVDCNDIREPGILIVEDKLLGSVSGACSVGGTEGAEVVVVRPNQPIFSALSVIAAYMKLHEAVLGLDTSPERPAYALLADGMAINAGYIEWGALGGIIRELCSSLRAFDMTGSIGVGYSSWIERDTLLDRLRSILNGVYCEGKLSIYLVDEHRSNSEPLYGIHGTDLLESEDISAAAIVALRTRSRRSRLVMAL